MRFHVLYIPDLSLVRSRNVSNEVFFSFFVSPQRLYASPFFSVLRVQKQEPERGVSQVLVFGPEQLTRGLFGIGYQWLVFFGQARLLLHVVGSGSFFSSHQTVQGVFILAVTGASHSCGFFFPQSGSLKARVKGRKKRLLVLEGPASSALCNLGKRLIAERQPDPYKGKGLRYWGQVFRLKKGKKKFV